MIIKIAQTADEINDAKMIRQHVFVKEQNVPLHIELDEYDKSATHFVGYINNEPICASRFRLINDYGKLERICLLKQYRGNGYGKKIVQAMENELLANNVFISRLNAQIQTKGFYKTFGYVVISDKFYEANIAHVTMEKRLSE